MKKSDDQQSGDKCPLGLLIGEDWYSQTECEFGCPNDIFYLCKDIRHSCTGKADFGSKIMADFAARAQSNIRRTYGSYECNHCGGWHVGSNWE